MILDVSEVTFRKWSYNPQNVKKEISESIFNKIAYLDLMRFKVHRDGDRWTIHTELFGKVICDEAPWKTCAALLYFTEERLSKEFHCYCESKIKEQRKGLFGYSRIAINKSLELPVGVTRWDFSKNEERSTTIYT